MQNRLEFHRARGHHVIFSAENFHRGLLSPAGWSILKTTLMQHWQVRVVVTYRRFYDWIPSLFYQHNRKKPLESLLTFLQERINNTTQHPVRATHDLYLQHFKDIYIFNLHQQGDAIANFICQVLPTANNVCQQLTLQQQYRRNATDEQEMRVRESHSFDAHKLVSEAKVRGLVSKKAVMYNRMVNNLAARLGQFQESNFTDYAKYVTCLPPYWTQRLLNLSLVLEEDVASISNSVEWLVSNRQAQVDEFQTNVARRKYCEVNAERVLDSSDATFARTLFDHL